MAVQSIPALHFWSYEHVSDVSLDPPPHQATSADRDRPSAALAMDLNCSHSSSGWQKDDTMQTCIAHQLSSTACKSQQRRLTRRPSRPDMPAWQPCQPTLPPPTCHLSCLLPHEVMVALSLAFGVAGRQTTSICSTTDSSQLRASAATGGVVTESSCAHGTIRVASLLRQLA